MAYSLEEMEEYLRDMYEQAGKGLEQKAVQYMLDFQRLEEQHKRDVQSGKWTQEQFDTWRKNKLLYGTHWTRMIQTVQRDMAKVNQTALDYINGKIPQIFAQTYNEVAEKVPKSPVSGYSFELVNADTVKNLVHEEGIILPPKKNLDKQKDKLWNAKQVNAQLLQGILQGESIKKIAARMQNVANADLVGATRTARTMCTAAENSGRQSAYNRAAEDGIKFTKTWIAALQGNTRDTHKYLNQQTQPHDKPFESSSGAVLMFPGDWHAPPAEVYNCRCTMITNFIGFDKVKLKEAVERQQEEIKETLQVVNDIDSVSTIQEVTNMLRASGWFRTSDKSNNLEGVDLESAKMIYRTYERLFNKYPFLKEKFLGVESETASENQFACASRQKIYVNTVWFSDYNNMRDEYLYSVKIKFHTKGTDVDSILVHEFGHNIDMFIAEVFERSSYYESSTFKRKVMNKFDKNINIRKEVSGYAEKNAQEWFAECFAEYFCSEEPRQVAKAFGEELEKLLEKTEKEYNNKMEKAKQKTKIKLGG